MWFVLGELSTNLFSMLCWVLAGVGLGGAVSSLRGALVLLLISCAYALVEDVCRSARVRGKMERMEWKFGGE